MSQDQALDDSQDEALDDEWVELEKTQAAAPQKPDVQVSLRYWRGKDSPQRSLRVKATIWLRKDAALWIERRGPRFRVQIGGEFCHLIRILPDARGGVFEASEIKGVKRICLGAVQLWPNETRPPTEATWRETKSGLLLELPMGFARAGQGQTAETEADAAPKPAARPKAQAFPITTSAPGLERQARQASGAERSKNKQGSAHSIGGQSFTAEERHLIQLFLDQDTFGEQAIQSAFPESGATKADVHIGRLRPRLRALNVSIGSVWGQGYRMDAASKARLRRFIDREPVEQ